MKRSRRLLKGVLVVCLNEILAYCRRRSEGDKASLPLLAKVELAMRDVRELNEKCLVPSSQFVAECSFDWLA